MSQIKPEYEKVAEFKEIAEKLLTKYPEVLDGIDINTLTCVAVMNKDPKEGKQPWEIKPVPYPIKLDNPYSAYIVVNNKQWEGMEIKHKAMLIFAALCSVDREDPTKTVPFDLKDHAVIVRTVGTDYLQRDDIVNILEEDVNWKVI